MKRFPIGFHLGIGGNAVGLRENFMEPLNAAGIQFFIKSTDDYPQDAVAVTLASGEDNTIVWRSTNFDVPDYSLTPNEAAVRHFNDTLSVLPQEFNRDLVWLEPINEVDKNRADWLGWFAVSWANLAQAEGLKIAMFGWSSGEPEPEHWLEPGMQAYLQLAAGQPARLAVSLHEYSFDVNDIQRWWPWLVGRYRLLFDACRTIGIPNVTTMITEWGWTLNDVPDELQAIADIDLIAQDYVIYPEILGAGLWYLGGGYGDIANDAQKLIAPVGTHALNWEHYLETPEPPSGDCDFDDTFTKYHILRPSVMSTSQWGYIRDLMEDGIPRSHLGIFGPGNVVVGYEGWSHVDAILAIKRAIDARYLDSRLIVVDGHLIGTGLDASWIEENCPQVAAHTVFLRSDGGAPSPFEFTHWPTEYRRVNLDNLFGANPQSYIDLDVGLMGHEGIDIRAYDGTEIYAVADGVISNIYPIEGSHNYGIFIRVQHRDGYETTYAHLKSVLPTWAVGDPVSGGELLGYANDTGNSYGSHLHITLKRDGYPYSDDVDDPWPYFIQDPTPFLRRLCSECFVSEPAPPAGQPALLGLHASADPALAAGELAMMQTADIEVVKVLSNMPREDVTAISDAFPNIPAIIRAFLSFGGRDVTPQQFFDWTYPDVREIVGRFGAGREVYVELHNEPNLFAEGLGSTWSNGVEFNNWLISVLGLYRMHLGGVEFLYPGLSPGGSVTGIRMDSTLFLEQSLSSANACDAVAVHNYWSSQWSMALALSQLETYTSRLGSKPMWITEASNNRGDITPTVKANEYIQYVHEVARWPNFKGVTYFVASASNPAWGWTGGSGEIWLGTDIPSIVGSR